MNGYVDLDLDVMRNDNKLGRTPFPHQMEAFEALNKVFTMPVNGYKGSLLVLPTGSGKTFTATNWISQIVLSRNIKVLWLAQSAYLLDQAEKSFIKELSNILPSRKYLKIRTVSSSSSHANSGSIELSDDVIIVTSQTAISDVLNETTGFKGESLKYKLRQWIDNCADSELFVVLDEAHHAPAYGCRNLLTELRKIVPNLYILGLTATPTHNDQRIRGWLDKIFINGICYQADINNLYQANILAKPVYVPKPTGRDMEVDDKLYDRIINQHKDLPDNIIDLLARDSARNNFIINDYIQNKDEYGKTIIFADRWFQCEYIVEKLKAAKVNGENIEADCVYVISSGKNNGSEDGQGRRDNKKNEEALRAFKEGKLDVLVNVKMLTEGVDVPDVKTVMITRNTTSGILFTQMIGRALRGKKAGAGPDKNHANIVMFMDNWKRLLPFASIADIHGETEGSRPIKRGIPPMEWISILLVKRACRDIQFIGKENVPSQYYIPVGWYVTEYTVAIDNEEQEMLTENNSVMVYESNIEAIKKMIKYFIANGTPENWSREDRTNEQLIEEIIPKVNGVLDLENDDVDGNLKNSIVNILRHIAQNGCEPEFIPFEIREQYDIDRLVKKYEKLNPKQIIIGLRADFYDSRLLWGKLYKRFDWFYQAYCDAVLRGDNNDLESAATIADPEEDNNGTKEDYRQAILQRDNHRCRCCGRQLGKGVKLELDHMIPVKMGGTTNLDNLQLLCRTCNSEKGTQHINFLLNKTQLVKPKEFNLIYTQANEPVDCSVARIINFFYHTDAVCNIQFNQRKSGKNYYVWMIQLHKGNPVEWLLPHKEKIVNYIQNELGWSHVRDIDIVNI